MKKIIIQGAGFADNFGDVLFYDIFIKESKRINVDVDLLSISNLVKRHLQPVSSETKNVINRINKAEGIVFIGGGYLGEPPAISRFEKIRWGLRTIKNILYIAPLGIILKKKIIVIGAGAGPITNTLTKMLVKKLANHSEKTIVRDVESYEFLSSINVKKNKLVQSVDTAILIRNYYDINDKSSNQKSIILHLSESPDKSLESKLILKEVEEFIESNPEYIIKAITDHNGGGQNRAISYLNNKYKTNIETHKYENPEELINFINNSNIVITNKLHVAIVAATLNKSVLSIPKHSKVIRFFKQIEESNRCIPREFLKEGDVFRLLVKYHDKNIKLDQSMFDNAEQNLMYFRNFVQS